MRSSPQLKDLLTADFGGQRIKSHLQLALQAIYAVVRDLAGGALTLRSMGLSYTTLVSMVPMLAFSFSVLKGFNVHNSLLPILDEFLAPMGAGGRDMARYIVGFVENMNLAVLGSAGLLMLVFTVISLVKKIEDSFNYIWNVSRGRSIAQRFRDYLSVLLVGPMMMVSAAGISTTLQQSAMVQELQAVHPLGALLVGLLRVLPKLLLFGAFAFLYSFIPNTRVQWRAAATGALVAAVLWSVAGWGFASFVASSAKYTAIYSSFAVLILFLIWLNLNWLFVLMGANIAYYVQNPDHLLLSRGALRPSARVRETIALQLMLNVARDYRRGELRWNGDALGLEVGIPRDAANLVQRDLCAAGLLVPARGDDPYVHLPGRAPDTILLEEILRAVSDAGQNFEASRQWDPVVRGLLAEADGAVGRALAGRTLADLVREQEQQEGRGRAVAPATGEGSGPEASLPG